MYRIILLVLVSSGIPMLSFPRVFKDFMVQSNESYEDYLKIPVRSITASPGNYPHKNGRHLIESDRYFHDKPYPKEYQPFVYPFLPSTSRYPTVIKPEYRDPPTKQSHQEYRLPITNYTPQIINSPEIIRQNYKYPSTDKSYLKDYLKSPNYVPLSTLTNPGYMKPDHNRPVTMRLYHTTKLEAHTSKYPNVVKPDYQIPYIKHGYNNNNISNTYRVIQTSQYPQPEYETSSAKKSYNYDVPTLKFQEFINSFYQYIEKLINKHVTLKPFNYQEDIYKDDDEHNKATEYLVTDARQTKPSKYPPVNPDRDVTLLKYKETENNHKKVDEVCKESKKTLRLLNIQNSHGTKYNDKN